MEPTRTHRGDNSLIGDRRRTHLRRSAILTLHLRRRHPLARRFGLFLTYRAPLRAVLKLLNTHVAINLNKHSVLPRRCGLNKKGGIFYFRHSPAVRVVRDLARACDSRNP